MIKLCFLNAYMISFYLSETFVFPSFCIWNDIYKVFNWIQLKLNETLIQNNCSCRVSPPPPKKKKNIYINYSLSAFDYNNYIDNIQGQTRTQNS